MQRRPTLCLSTESAGIQKKIAMLTTRRVDDIWGCRSLGGADVYGWKNTKSTKISNYSYTYFAASAVFINKDSALYSPLSENFGLFGGEGESSDIMVVSASEKNIYLSFISKLHKLNEKNTKKYVILE